MITVKPIFCTADPRAWHTLATDRGLAAAVPPPAARLVPAGHQAAVHDEAFNRIVRFPGPDGTEIRINEVQTDLYGFREHS